ncbi:SCO family protein [Cytobacillus suaedae]|nr:SCO family protein [Cytobacillus suaedae]
MKKLYITFISLLVVGILGGIFYFTLYRQASMDLPEDVVMETAYGEEYVFSELEPKVRLIEFIYINCPDICPATTHKMKQLREKLEAEGVFGDKVEFLTITIDPERDTQHALKQYGKAFGIENQKDWVLLRGSDEATQQVAEAFDFLYRDPGNGMIIHTTSTYLIDEENHIIEVLGMDKQFDTDKVFAKIMKEI